jgi:DNA-binding NarL/FixJ family response regulator
MSENVSDPAILGTVALRCIIIDDNAGFLSAARDVLERQGIAVVGTASTTAEAVELARKMEPDVALVDIDLGDESGFDVALRLTEMAGNEQLRLVLISAYAESDFADLIAASPAVGFLSKPDLSASALHELLG